MHVVALDNTLDYEAWLDANTAYCKRHQTRLTIDACKLNQSQSAAGLGNLHCTGCKGLNNQPGTRERSRLYLAYPHHTDVDRGIDAGIEDEKDEAEDLDSSPLTQALIEALQEILDETEEPEPEEQQAAVDPLTQALLAGLQGLQNEDDYRDQEPEPAAIRERPEQKKRVRVYVGRCERCKGYMAHSEKECHGSVVDDEVYRCLNCGWRTSPGYDYIRKHPGEGWR